MKKILLVVAVLTAGAAFAIQQLDISRSPRLQQFISGVVIGPESVNPSDARLNANRITRTLSGSATINFASATITCEDSSAITVLGARTGDPCFVGIPSTLTAGGTGLHHSFTCYVSATNAVKVRACAVGTADDPGSVTYNVRVLSNQ